MSEQVKKMVEIVATGDDELDAISFCLKAIGHLDPLRRAAVITFVAERNARDYNQGFPVDQGQS
jgi:hypothetical protein